MRDYSLLHLSDDVLLRDLAALVAQDHTTTAAMLAHIAEVDTRRLYRPAAYPSMHAYCVHELRLSEDSAYKRITAARVARQYPAIFERLADGRLHLAAVGLLAPYLKTENASELLSAAAYKSKSEVEQLIAERFPRSELLPLIQVMPTASCEDGELARSESGPRDACCNKLAPGRVVSHALLGAQLAARPVESPTLRSSMTPLAAQRFVLQLSIGQSAHDKLCYARELLGHQVPSGDIGAVIELALDALIAKQEKSKFAATGRPQRKPRRTRSDRHIPAHVKRAVLDRDGGQCTFVSEAGKRCPSRTRLQFDHADPVARGGEATVENIRLRCAPHNQFTAECEFGTEFMERKRQDARGAAAERARAKTAARERADAQAAAEAELVPCLRQLGYRADEARAAARFSASDPDASLEQRVRKALSYFRLRTTTSQSAGNPQRPAAEDCPQSAVAASAL